MPERAERLSPFVAAALLFALFAVYYRPGPALSPNDGSHQALLKALVLDHTFCIDRHVADTMHVDYSVHGGHYYSDRAPGTAFMAALFAWAGLGGAA